MAVLIFLILHWYLSLFGQTFYLHRYSAHKMFTMSPFWEKYFYIFTWVTQGSSYLNARARPNFAAKWWEIDPVYPIIKLFNKVGIIRLISLKYSS